MAKNTCLLCGQELSFRSRQSIEFYGVEQPLCAGCKERYTRAKAGERAKLEQQLLDSPDLRLREHILYLRSENEEVLRQQRAKADQLAQKTAHRNACLLCCGREMDYLGVSRFQLGEYSVFTKNLSHLDEGSMKMAVYQCGSCGQFKFFKPIPDEE